MGYFRRLKKTFASKDKCERMCKKMEQELAESTDAEECKYLAEKWATYRELQARHEQAQELDMGY